VGWLKTMSWKWVRQDPNAAGLGREFCRRLREPKVPARGCGLAPGCLT